MIVGPATHPHRNRIGRPHRSARSRHERGFGQMVAAGV